MIAVQTAAAAATMTMTTTAAIAATATITTTVVFIQSHLHSKRHSKNTTVVVVKMTMNFQAILLVVVLIVQDGPHYLLLLLFHNDNYVHDKDNHKDKSLFVPIYIIMENDDEYILYVRKKVVVTTMNIVRILYIYISSYSNYFNYQFKNLLFSWYQLVRG